MRSWAARGKTGLGGELVGLESTEAPQVTFVIMLSFFKPPSSVIIGIVGTSPPCGLNAIH